MAEIVESISEVHIPNEPTLESTTKSAIVSISSENDNTAKNELITLNMLNLTSEGLESRIMARVEEITNNIATKLKREYDEKLEAVKTEHNQAMEALEKKYTEILELKSTTIIQTTSAHVVASTTQLSKDIEDLKLSGNFLTAETKKLDQKIESNASYTEQNEDFIYKLKDRADNAEDQSRRCNLLFFKMKEADGRYESPKECETKVQDVIKDVMGNKNDVPIDRVHRLGRKSMDSEGKMKTRPMIARFTYPTHRDDILKKLREKGETQHFAISEDFCKNTQNIRKSLLGYLKFGKDKNTNISGGHLKYKTLVVIFKGQDDSKIYSHYTLNELKDNPTWYEQPKPVKRWDTI